jgi:UDP-3-O-[3-hydroxymyristoyl] glucosamine N-acyltransferase
MKVLGDSTELLPVVPPISLFAEDSSNSNVATIHPTALIESGAMIGKGTTIGPYCVIDGNVVIGDNCKLVAHVHVTGHTTIGPRTVISPFASLGAPAQSVNFRGGLTRLVVGADCDVRQSVTMNAGTEDGGGITEVGERGFFMANCHVGHDCHVGNDVVMANCAGLGGHCVVGDHVFIGALSGVHQHDRWRIRSARRHHSVRSCRWFVRAAERNQCRRNETKSVFRRSHPRRSVSISSDIFRQRCNGAAYRRCRIEIW